VIIISTTNITVRIDEETKKDFDAFCKNVGINATTAVNMFIKAVLRTRELPFIITDVNEKDKKIYGARAIEAIERMRKISAQNGNSLMSLDNINAEINAARNESANIYAKNSN